MWLDLAFPCTEHVGLRQRGFFTVRGPCRREYCGAHITAQTLACRWVRDWTPTVDCGSTSQGPRTASDPGWDPSRPHAGAARHAGARTALPAPRASGHREDSRREGHHPGAQRDVGDGRRARIHARRRVGLDLRGGRTLERGVCGVARVQSREPLRGTRSDCARARTSLWLAVG